MKNLWDFVYECGCEIEFVSEKADELNVIINNEADKRANEIAEKKFNARKEDFMIDAIKQLQEEGIKKEGIKLSSASSLISETYSVGNVELMPSDFVPDTFETNQLYEENLLVKNQYSLEYHEINSKTGKHKFVWKETSVLVLIVNPIATGKCEAILVYLNSMKNPLCFINGNISEEAFRKQTTFARKGLNVSVKLQYESFLHDVRECHNKMFLTIPKHAGGVKLSNGKYTYISSDSVIQGLEDLFPSEVREHKMVSCQLLLKDMSTIYRNSLPNRVESKLATIIRVESILLPLFEAAGLHSDHGFVLSYNNEHLKKTAIALTKRKNYTSMVVQELTDRITKIRKTLVSANDVTVIFTFSDIFNEKNTLDNAFKEILWDITEENNTEERSRKIITFITNNPESIPEDYPVYYINFDEENTVKNWSNLQRMSGKFDYVFINYIYSNPDTADQLIYEGIESARQMISNSEDMATDTMIMTLATANILMRLNIVTDSDLEAILHWFMTTATSKSTINDVICCKFKTAVSTAILNGELKIAKQIGPLYYSDDGYTAFIRDEDKSLNLNDDTIKNVIMPKIPLNSMVKLNRCLYLKGLLKGNHTNKRKLKVAYDAGVLEDIEIFSYSRSVLTTEAKAYVDDIINNEYWFTVEEYPAGFVPILYNADSTKTAGYVFTPDMDENLHEVYFGATRSGKTFALVNRSIEKVEVEGADAVIIFDQTGGFSPLEIDKHIGTELREKYFFFWNVYEDGLPIDLLDLRGCLTYKDKKERLLRVYAMMSRTLGSYEEQILKNAIKCMLRDLKNNSDMTIFDTSKYICENTGKDEAATQDMIHRKLLYKLDAVLDDLHETPQSKNNWGEFASTQERPIIVISTGDDCVGKGSEIVDILLESLYSYKQCHPYERFTVVVDEAQDLYLHEKGALNTILRKGGKHGITMLLASQAFPDPTTAFGKVVGNCGRTRGYRSKGNDLAYYADRFKCEKFEADTLQKGNCFDNGIFYSRYRDENVITTIKGKTVTFVPARDINSINEDKQP